MTSCIVATLELASRVQACRKAMTAAH